MDTGILQGTRVLDFTRVLAGPYATRFLADFGAEVIKVQSEKLATGTESEASPYFRWWNRNKRSITLNLGYPEARQMALRLVAISDVVVENFSPRVMSNWDLDYQRLKQAKPDLIMLSMSGMGQTGPWKDFVAFGPTLQSLGGLTFLSSYDAADPVGLGYSYVDHISALYGVLAILAALEHRDRTGLGQYIDLSEYEAASTMIGPSLLDASVNHREVLPRGNRSDDIPAAPYGCYKCLGKERWCVMAVFSEAQWQSLCLVLGEPLWAMDEAFSSLSARKSNWKKLDHLIEQWTMLRSAEETVELLQKAGVPSGVVHNAEDIAHDPQFAARRFFVNLQDPILGDIVMDTYPARVEGIQKVPWEPAPRMGEDNHYVYRDLLGLTESEISHYILKGVIG